MKACTKCGQEYEATTEFFRAERRAHGPQLRAQCRECERKQTSAYQQKYIPSKGRAWTALHEAVKRGDVVPQPCEVCGEKAQAHHDDYGKPLDVRWLCTHHHRLLHNGALTDLALAEKRIAELEAEVKEHIEREYEQRQRARRAEAELAALKARRCETCFYTYVCYGHFEALINDCRSRRGVRRMP